MKPTTLATILFAILLAIVAKPDGGHQPIVSASSNAWRVMLLP